MTRTRTDETGRRLNFAVGLVVFGALCVLAGAVFAGIQSGTFQHPPIFRIIGTLVMIVVADRPALYVRVRSDRHRWASTDVGFLIGMMLLPWELMLLAVAVAI